MKKFIFGLLVILIIISGVGFFTKDYFFGSRWMHQMNDLVDGYNSKAVLFEDAFESVDLATVVDNESALLMSEKLSSARELFNQSSNTVQDTVHFVIVESPAHDLSVFDEESRNMYEQCYLGREEGYKLLGTGLRNSIAYVDIFYELQDLRVQLGSFIAVGREASLSVRLSDDEKTIELFKQLEDSIVTVKGTIDTVNSVFKADYLTRQSEFFDVMYGLSRDTIVALEKNDIATYLALDKSMNEIGIEFFGSDSEDSDFLSNWLVENIVTPLTDAQSELDKVHAICTEAELKSKPKFDLGNIFQN